MITVKSQLLLNQELITLSLNKVSYFDDGPEYLNFAYGEEMGSGESKSDISKPAPNTPRVIAINIEYILV